MGSRKSDRNRTCRGVLLFSILLSFNLILSGGENSSERLVFPLEKVSGFDDLGFGQGSACRNDPEPNVAYPAVSSGKALFGAVIASREVNRMPGVIEHRMA